MKAKIVELAPKKLVGMRMQMSLENNKTAILWSSFMPRRKEVLHAVEKGFYSMQSYDPNLDFSTFNPTTTFEKRAMIEVLDFENIPEKMEAFDFKGGAYAVFLHKGPASRFQETAKYIYGVWLPNSGYELDNSRPHFEFLGDNYSKADPENSEEDVYIPIK